MKHSLIYPILLFSLVLFSFNKDQGVAITKVKVKAPFDMPEINVSDFSKCKKLLITDFGAVPGDKAKTSQAIAKAIYTLSWTRY